MKNMKQFLAQLSVKKILSQANTLEKTIRRDLLKYFPKVKVWRKEVPSTSVIIEAYNGGDKPYVTFNLRLSGQFRNTMGPKSQFIVGAKSIWNSSAHFENMEVSSPKDAGGAIMLQVKREAKNIKADREVA